VTPTGEIRSRDERHKAVLGGSDEWKTWKGRYVERDSGDNFSFNPFMSLADYLAAHEDVLVIRENEIRPEERTGELRQEGYVWVD